MADGLEAVGRLAGGVAHDFNNLLAIVLGNLSLITELAGENSSIREHSQMAKHAANKATDLVQQLLGYSRKSRLILSVLHPRELIAEACKLFTSKVPDTFRIAWDVEDDCWDIHGDETQILQVLINIFENALHATEGNGRVHISCRNYVLNDRDLSEAFECDPGHYVVITISDDGRGMPPEVRERVFEPFFTTKEVGEGTGLGMANALGIIKQHGGCISCTSAESEGTAFSLYLPRHRSESERRRVHDRGVPSIRSTAISGEPAVLVVDDEELLRNLVRALCEKNGYRTLGAVDGVEALEIIESHPGEIFAAVIDLAMPRMTGTDLIHQIGERGEEFPVIVASGFLVDVEKFIEETGVEPFAILSKPYQLNELIEKINEIREQSEVVLTS